MMQQPNIILRPYTRNKKKSKNHLKKGLKMKRMILFLAIAMLGAFGSVQANEGVVKNVSIDVMVEDILESLQLEMMSTTTLDAELIVVVNSKGDRIFSGTREQAIQEAIILKDADLLMQTSASTFYLKD